MQTAQYYYTVTFKALTERQMLGQMVIRCYTHRYIVEPVELFVGCCDCHSYSVFSTLKTIFKTLVPHVSDHSRTSTIPER